MRPSFRTYFLIVMAAVILHAPELLVGVTLVGYAVFDWLDQWLARRARANAIEDNIADVLYDWKPDPEDQEEEEKGDFTRRRIRDDNLVLVVGRIAELLRRLALAWNDTAR
jgi:hypothetical protein